MGCTSSAPNTLSAHENSADEGVQIEDSNEFFSKTDAVQTLGDIPSAVLPMCDVVETIVKHNRSSASLEFQNEKKGYDNVESEISQNIETLQDTETEEKLSKLEEVVEKVVEINQSNSDHQCKENSTEDPSSNDSKEDITNEDKIPQEPEIMNEKKEDGNEEQEIELENAEEDNSEESSDQSEFSHATRWEALADIVAELPPSLAVDPFTGQIYSLTK